MKTIIRLAAAAAGLSIALGSMAWAQDAKPVRVRGTIEKVDGNTITAKLRDGSQATIKLADTPRITALTKADVGSKVEAVDGQTLVVKYTDGEKKIIVPPSTPIVRFNPGNKDDLKPGAQFFIVAGTKQADGTMAAPAINVGRDGAAPPM